MTTFVFVVIVTAIAGVVGTGLGGLIGVQVGLNLVSALVVGALGAPGFGLLLLAQWALR